MVDLHIYIGEQEIIAFFVGCAKGLIFWAVAKLLWNILIR